jgi:hypothetical protein
LIVLRRLLSYNTIPLKQCAGINSSLIHAFINCSGSFSIESCFKPTSSPPYEALEWIRTSFILRVFFLQFLILFDFLFFLGSEFSIARPTRNPPSTVPTAPTKPTTGAPTATLYTCIPTNLTCVPGGFMPKSDCLYIAREKES